MWMTNEMTKSFQNQYAITNKFADYKGENIHIELFNSDALQQIALINFRDNAKNYNRQIVMIQRYNFIESEMLAHIPYCTASQPKHALICGTLNATIAYWLAKYGIKVDMVVGDMEALHTLSGFIPNFKEIKEHANIEFYERFMDIKQSGYDIIIHASSPKLHEFEALKKMANKKFICIFGLANLYLEPSLALDTLALAMNFGHIMMPFTLPTLTPSFYTFLSNYSHPLADLQLQKSDMLEDMQCYNSNLHINVFRLPTFLHNMTAPYVKN